jgi:hypothetical protein
VVKTATRAQDGGARTPEDIAVLFTVAGREDEAIQQLTCWVAQLHEVQAAKGKLATLTPAEVRAALEYRRASVGEAQ